MNIVSITDTKGTRSGGWSGNAGRTYKLELQVITDDPNMGIRSVIQALGFRNGDWYRWPLVGTANEWDYGSFIQSIQAQEVADDGKQWRVSLDFAPFDWTTQGGATTEAAADGRFDPFKVPPRSGGPPRSSTARRSRTPTASRSSTPRMTPSTRPSARTTPGPC